jgi:hypothetical protein
LIAAPAFHRGGPSDATDFETIDGLGNRENEIMLLMIGSRGVQADEGSVPCVRAAGDARLARAVPWNAAEADELEAK